MFDPECDWAPLETLKWNRFDEVNLYYYILLLFPDVLLVVQRSHSILKLKFCSFLWKFCGLHVLVNHSLRESTSLHHVHMSVMFACDTYAITNECLRRPAFCWGGWSHARSRCQPSLMKSVPSAVIPDGDVKTHKDTWNTENVKTCVSTEEEPSVDEGTFSQLKQTDGNCGTVPPSLSTAAQRKLSPVTLRRCRC